MNLHVNADWARFQAHGVNGLGHEGFAQWLKHAAGGVRTDAKREHTPKPPTSRSLARFAAETARTHDARLGRMAQAANNIANETGDQRWNEAALALLGARRFFRGLMNDGEAGHDHVRAH